MNQISYEQVLANAQAQGLDTFEFQGYVFAVETQGPTTARQTDLQQTPAGQLIGSSAIKRPGYLNIQDEDAATLLNFNEKRSTNVNSEP